MSVINYSEKQYQVVKDLQEVKMKINLSTNDCEDVSQNCVRGEPDECDVNIIHELSINLKGKKIYGDIWLHASHDYLQILEYGITFYDVNCFTVDLELKMEKIGNEAILEKKIGKFSNNVEKLADAEMTPNSVHEKLHHVLLMMMKLNSILVLTQIQNF